MYPVIKSTTIKFHNRTFYGNIVLDKTGKMMTFFSGMYWRVNENKKGEYSVTAGNPISGKYL
jgi:hypothetical protein